MVNAQTLDPLSMRVYNLGDRVAVAKVGHQLLDPGIDEVPLVQKLKLFVH